MIRNILHVLSVVRSESLVYVLFVLSHNESASLVFVDALQQKIFSVLLKKNNFFCTLVQFLTQSKWLPEGGGR